MASVLVIGVGTTGLDVLEQAQQYHFELTKQYSPKNSAFMFLETANKTVPPTSEGKTRIEECHIYTENVEATLNPWRQSKKFDWLPMDADVLNQHDGAANQPAFGRVALWANEEKVRNLIHELYSRINGDQDTNIYIVGSLTGGTGTGVFMDLAYMVRHVTENSNIYGMFMLPSRTKVGQDGMDLLYENAYSSLRTLDYYSVTKKSTDDEDETSSNYSCVLPSGTKISSKSVPFRNAQFFTQDFANASASLPTITQLIQTVGFNLVLRLLGVTNQTAALQNMVNSKKVDFFSYVKHGLYSTIGLNVYQYPEALLEEYFTHKLLEDGILKRWADTQTYIDQNGVPAAVETLKANLKLEAKRFVQDTIELTISDCQGHQMLGKANFDVALHQEIAAIRSGNYQAPSQSNYIYSLFDANSQAPKFYAGISGQATNLRDLLIVAIGKKIAEESNRYQNLTIVELLLSYIAQELKNVLLDWNKRYQLDGTAPRWNQCWQVHCRERISATKSFYGACGCMDEWYQEALGGVAELCYYNTYIPMIKSVADSMLDRQNKCTIATTDGVKLPTLKDLDESKEKVAMLLNSQDNQSVVARRASLYGRMTNDSHSQIHFLFNGESCDADIEVADGKYKNQQKRLSFSDLSNDSLWQFLQEKSAQDIKSVMTSRGLFFVQGLNLFANTDVVRIMCNLQENHKSYNRVHSLLTKTQEGIVNDVPAMVHLVDTEMFHTQDSLKLIIMSALSEDNEDGIVSKMVYKPSATQRNYVQITSLKNTIVVYQEYGYLGSINGVAKAFNPLLHICYQEQVKEKIMEKMQSNAFDEAMRLAYIDAKILMDDKHINIK